MSRNFHGIISTLFSAAAFRSYLAKRMGIEFDRRYGTDTLSPLSLSEMAGVDARLLDHAVQYEVSAIPKFRRAMSALRKAGVTDFERYSFVDFGSGKGLVAMLASQMAFRRVYGVEMAPALHRVAEHNVSIFQQKGAVRAPISLSCGDALAYVWPAGHVVAYLYNPFDELLTGQFLDRLAGEADGSGRSIVVVYINPIHRRLFDRRAAFREAYSDSTLCVYTYTDPSGERSRAGL